jgi:hypothetical protein
VAGDWIKMRGNLWDDPRVSRLCDITGQTEAPIIGALYWLWSAADQHTEDGCMPGLTLRQIDRKTGVTGFAAALIEVGWLRDDPQGVVIVHFTEHNGASAKRRCMDAQRKANSRGMSASDADTERTDDGQIAQFCGAREEKRREEENIEPTALVASADAERAARGYTVPPCPTQEIVGAYSEALPMLPQVTVLNDSRRRAVAARWREVCGTDRMDVAQGREWFRWYFDRVRGSPFLMGNGAPGRGGRVWRADFDWLMNPTNFARVTEGRYHGGKQA